MATRTSSRSAARTARPASTAAKRSTTATKAATGTAAKKTATKAANKTAANTTRKPATRAVKGTARKSTRSSTTAARRVSDALTVLEKDHAEVKKMYRAYERLVKNDASGSERKALARRICAALTLHANAEEEIFYPALRPLLKDQDLLDEAEVEHASAKELIAQIQGMSPKEPLYDAKVIVLCEYVAHHVEEEEDEMFPKVRRLKGLDLVELGRELKAYKAAHGAA